MAEASPNPTVAQVTPAATQVVPTKDGQPILKRYSKDAKKYVLVGRQHSGFSEDGTTHMEFVAGDEVMLEPNEYAAFKDKFREVDESKKSSTVVRKNAADEAHEINEKIGDDLDNPDDAPPPGAGAPIGVSTGSGQGPGGTPMNVAIENRLAPTASDGAPTGQSGKEPLSKDTTTAGSPQAAKQETGKPQTSPTPTGGTNTQTGVGSTTPGSQNKPNA